MHTVYWTMLLCTNFIFRLVDARYMTVLSQLVFIRTLTNSLAKASFLSINLVHFVTFFQFRSVQKKNGKNKENFRIAISLDAFNLTRCLHLFIFFNKNLAVFEVSDIATYNRNYKATKQRISRLPSSNTPSLCGRECLDIWSALEGNLQTLQCIAKKHNGIFNPYLLEFFYSKNPKMRDPILETLFKTQPYHSHSRRENATPSSGTSPLA